MGDWNASFWKNEGPFMAACFLPCIGASTPRLFSLTALAEFIDVKNI